MITLPKTKQETSQYLPHSGSMCLIDEVIAINELQITARTYSHQDKYNPLRFDGKLPGVSSIEYAAQVVALHLELSTTSKSDHKKNCYLAAVQNCVMHIPYIDLITCSLNIDCMQVFFDNHGGALYEFKLSAESETVFTGRLLIMFNEVVS